jgi:hypothetical protein
MFTKLLPIAAAASLVASPCAAASLENAPEIGERRSGAVAGLYLSMPIGGKKSGKAQAGLRLQAMHDYRNAAAPAARVFQADALDLRLVGDKKATLYVAGMPVTGEEAKRNNLLGGSSTLTIAVLALAVVGAFVVIQAIDDTDVDEECFDDPQSCD